VVVSIGSNTLKIAQLTTGSMVRYDRYEQRPSAIVGAGLTWRSRERSSRCTAGDRCHHHTPGGI